MNLSAKEMNIEITPEELAALLTPRGEAIPAVQDETEDEGKDLQIHANIFMPAEPTEMNITCDVDKAGDEDKGTKFTVSESGANDDTELTKAEAEVIFGILSDGVARKHSNRHWWAHRSTKDGVLTNDIECDNGRRFTVTMRRK